MKRLSQHAHELISKLAKANRPSMPARIAGNISATRVELIRALADTRESAALPALRDALLDDNRATRESAAAAIHQLLTEVRPRDYVWLDHFLRATYMLSYRWHEELKVGHVASVCAASPFRTTLLGVASAHRDGRIREQAVRTLDEFCQEGEELPFLLVRCNDWVPQVRAAAVSGLLRRLRDTYTARWIDCLPLVRRLECCARADHTELLARVRQWLFTPTAEPGLLAGLSSEDFYLRRVCFQLLMDAGRISADVLLQRAAKDPDYIVRFLAVTAARQRLNGSRLHEMLGHFAGDRSPHIRMRALEQLAKCCPNSATATLEARLLDASAPVRDVARYWLHKQQPARSFRVDYLAALQSASGREQTAALQGLGETGEAGDNTTVLNYAADPLPRNRRAVLRALHNLDRAALAAQIPVGLADPSPGVSRAALRFALGLVPPLSPAVLHQLIANTNCDHVARNALTLLAQQSTWDAGIAILRTCCDTRVTVAAYAVTSLGIWANRPYVPDVPPAHPTERRNLLRTLASRVPPEVLARLDFMVRTTSASH